MYDNKLDSAKKYFVKYLENLGISSKSLKNYKSDLSHFSAWIIIRVKTFGSYIESLSEAIPFLSEEIAIEYKTHMVVGQVPAKTINRRLSTLRHFSRSLVASQLIDNDFALNLENMSTSNKTRHEPAPLVSEFGTYLEAKKISKNTIKNYLSDTRQFLSWLETNKQIYKYGNFTKHNTRNN